MLSKTIMVFIDGIGMGQPNSHNPFFQLNSPIFPFFNLSNGVSELPFGGKIKAIDATLGVEGVPQSATGQTALFTGINASKHIGGHLSAFPNKELRSVLYGHNLFKQLSNLGIRPCFANAYPKISEAFLEKKIILQPDGELIFTSDIPNRTRRHISVTTTIILANQIIPFGISELQSDKTIYQDFSNQLLIDKGAPLSKRTPRESAQILSKLVSDYDFVLYEYFLTDLYGHQKPFEDCLTLIAALSEFVDELAKQASECSFNLIITSDHGNIEDMSHRDHTYNKVPLMVWGEFSQDMLSVESLLNVTPAIVGMA